MALHVLPLEPRTLHGFFSREVAPVLTIDSGDVVRFQTLDSGWGERTTAVPFTRPRDFEPRDRQRHPWHALSGPVAFRDAQPGMTLEAHLLSIRPGPWGWSAGRTLPAQLDGRIGLPHSASGPPAVITVPDAEQATFWSLDADQGIGTAADGRRLRLRPFPGTIGMPLDEPGIQSTFPPCPTGGNMDCKELVAGSRLFLPIAVPGGLFSVGDGHAIQGDGEVSGPALNCPMDLDIEFHLHAEPRLTRPRARTPAGWITFGFHEDLNEACVQATLEMLTLMGELHGLGRKEALGLAGLVVDLRVTQIVNGVRGVHAVLPHDALT